MIRDRGDHLALIVPRPDGRATVHPISRERASLERLIRWFRANGDREATDVALDAWATWTEEA